MPRFSASRRSSWSSTRLSWSPSAARRSTTECGARARERCWLGRVERERDTWEWRAVQCTCFVCCARMPWRARQLNTAAAVAIAAGTREPPAAPGALQVGIPGVA